MKADVHGLEITSIFVKSNIFFGVSSPVKNIQNGWDCLISFISFNNELTQAFTPKFKASTFSAVNNAYICTYHLQTNLMKTDVQRKAAANTWNIT